MQNDLKRLSDRLSSLSVFNSIHETELVNSFQWLVSALSDATEADFPDVDRIKLYSSFVSEIYKHGGNLTEYIRDYVEGDENCYLVAKLAGKPISPSLEEALMADLDALQELAHLTADKVKAYINYDGFLPSWEYSDINIKDSYMLMLDNLNTKGYGMFAKYKYFVPQDGTLVPIVKSDPISLSQLYGYERERNQVLANTEALAAGKCAANVLLYGDAGTGKSSTIKACANALFDNGVRLIQFDKYQLAEIPRIIEYLGNNPLKFIFFIDDLSFSQNDDDYCYLKGILEGGATAYSDNIVIYATTNRRHIIAESFESRMGNDLHVNDTLQETMSLSARFGLNITFSKPEKELFLEIVKQLAEEYGVPVTDDLFTKAEAFAIRANGRSPRTAKQFIQKMSV